MLTLTIEDSPYRLTRLCGPGAWLLTRGSLAYTVTRMSDRVTCTCPHYRYRITGTERCKHGSALVECGILDGHPIAAPEPVLANGEEISQTAQAGE